MNPGGFTPMIIGQALGDVTPIYARGNRVNSGNLRKCPPLALLPLEAKCDLIASQT